MISQILAPLEKTLGSLYELMDVDAVMEGEQLRTTFISTEHDPGVGIRGGEVFTLWWELYGKAPWGPMERKRWPARKQQEDFPTDVKVVKERWLVPKEEWLEDLEGILVNRKMVYDAMMQWFMRPF